MLDLIEFRSGIFFKRKEICSILFKFAQNCSKLFKPASGGAHQFWRNRIIIWTFGYFWVFNPAGSNTYGSGPWNDLSDITTTLLHWHSPINPIIPMGPDFGYFSAAQKNDVDWDSWASASTDGWVSLAPQWRCGCPEIPQGLPSQHKRSSGQSTSCKAFSWIFLVYLLTH